MNPSQLDQLLKFLTETLQQGKDFTLEQAPQFVKELLYWRFYEAAFFVGLGVALLLVGLIVTWFLCSSEDDEVRAFRGVPLLVGLAAFLILGSVNIHTMIQVKVAPRVVLVEMVRYLVAGQR